MNATTETTPSNMNGAASMETAKAVTPPAEGTVSSSPLRPSGEVMTAFCVPTSHAAPPIAGRRTTRQFDLGNGYRLIDMRETDGGLDVIPEGPGVCFDHLPKMSEREAILAALDYEAPVEHRLGLIRRIIETTAEPDESERAI